MVIANKSFVDACLAGQAVPSEIRDYVDFWHDRYRGCKTLVDFLGFNTEEAEAWVKNDDTVIPKIIECRKSGTSITDALYNERRGGYGHAI